MIVFIPTVQHTGTWFVINFLSNYIPELKEASVIVHDNEMINGPAMLHTHFPALYHETPLEAKSLPIDSICLLASLFKTVIPVRDPLLAILTREWRHPELRHFYIVDGFIQMADRLLGNDNVMFLPVDLPLNVSQRHNLLNRIIEHCGIENTGNITLKIAREWKHQNITPGNRLKELYLKKDIKRLNYLLGPKVAEVRYLQNHASKILPFMSSLGYTKDDLILW